MNSTPSYGVHRIMGAETEYGVIAPSAPGTNPTVLSALVVNTYATAPPSANSCSAVPWRMS